jgi:lipopolysaccharide transport system ATP-binding protein
VPRGTTLGLIGHNGSGKSTTLKLVTRILEPTSGHVTVRGRVSALLELGSGFHPDLSGRDNVYLNGSLLGFNRRDMDRRIDEIIDFAELGPFIDTPVKHYPRACICASASRSPPPSSPIS